MLKHIAVTEEATHCSTCMMGSVCLPVGMPAAEIAKLDDLVKDRIRLEKGQRLYQHGEKLDALFGLRTGSLKTQLDEANGMHQITGFVPSLQQQVRRLMSREIARSHQVLLALGSMRSEQRLAAFLLNLSQRMTALGYSSSEFIMRMSREELGNYLGLTLETVSRLFSRFAREGVIIVNQRDIKIIDMAALNELLGKPC